jgi:hypothetical protein
MSALCRGKYQAAKQGFGTMTTREIVPTRLLRRTTGESIIDEIRQLGVQSSATMVTDMTSRFLKSILIVPIWMVPAFADGPAKPASESKPAATTRTQAETAGSRVFELRTYYTNEGKLDDLHKRFRDHTCQLLKKHGADVIGFWTPQDDKDGKGSRLVYLLAFPSREAAEKTWKEFRDDPEWKKVYAESHKNGVLVKKVESVFLVPTDYSALK